MEHQLSRQSQKSKQGKIGRDQDRVSSPGRSGPQASPLAIVQRAANAPDSLTPADVIRLQRAMGNEAVGRLLNAPEARQFIGHEMNYQNESHAGSRFHGKHGPGPQRNQQINLPGNPTTITRPIIQRLQFTGSGGDNVEVTADEIVQKLHEWMISTLQSDTQTHPPVNLQELFGRDGDINWTQAFSGGHMRNLKNVFDIYALLVEMKRHPGYLFRLQHLDGKPDSFSQVASSLLNKTASNSSIALMDGLVRPPDDLDESVQGQGVAYTEMKESFTNLKTSMVDDSIRTEQQIARDHLSLLSGTRPDGYHDDEIMKMYYHLTVMMAAEGRRDIGMFPFGPITLQNMADGLITVDQAFGGDKEETKAYPAAWVGSKNPLESIEEHVRQGGTIRGGQTHYADPIRVLDKMKKQIELFFSTASRRQFNTAPLNTLPGAGFTEKTGALEAIINYIKKEYFASIPAMFPSGGPEPATRAENRQTMATRTGQQSALITMATSMRTHALNPESLAVARGDVDEFVEDAKTRTQGPRPEHHQRVHRIVWRTKRKLAESDSFSGDVSETEFQAKMDKLAQKRQNKKRRNLNSVEYQAGKAEAQAGNDSAPSKYPGDALKQRDYELGWTDEREILQKMGYAEGAAETAKSHGGNKFYDAAYASGKSKRGEVVAAALSAKDLANPDQSAVIGEDVPLGAREILTKLYFATYYS